MIEFDDFETAELAAELIGKTIGMKTDNEDAVKNISPSPSSLLHYKIIDQLHGEIGTVTGFLDIPGNPCLQTDYKGREVIIPFHKDLVKKTDDKKRILQVALPTGLLEL